MSNRKNILLTGANGFLGSHLLRAFAESDQYKAIALKRSTSDTSRITEFLDHPNVVIVDIDLCDDLNQLFQDHAISGIVHTAVEYGRENHSVHKILSTNMMFPISLIEYAIKHNVEFFLNTDSYFNKSNMSYSYLLHYSLSKKSLLTWLKYFSKDIKVINGVLEHIYGEYDSSTKFLEFLIQEIAIKKKKTIDVSHGDQRRDFIYVKDVVSAYLKLIDFALHNKFRYRNFEIGTSQSVPLKQLIRSIIEISDSPTIPNFGAIPYRKDEIMDSHADIVELENLGWKPEYTLEQGLSNIINCYRNHE